jgi:pyruvate kinase
MERVARTKIVATLGPSSGSYNVLRKMVAVGLDIGRFNFSHGTYSEHLKRIEILREINKKYRRRVRFLQDLEGFRIRIGRFIKDEKKHIKRNSTVYLTSQEDDGDPRTIPFDYTGDLKTISPGTLIYIDDGNIILEAKSCTKNKIAVKVLEGEWIKERKGVNIPAVRMPFSSITEKDKNDVRFGLKHEFDYVAQSFVRTAGDIETIRQIVKPKLPGCKVVAKIENREAIKNIDDIIDAADLVMIARGDMGIAVPIYQIAVIQKVIIKKCNAKKKPVITATQMLEHMTEHSRPTRAEVTDVANAILDGTDYVMLSAESAAGKYPVESVRMMDRIIKYTETFEKSSKKKALHSIPISF